MLTARNLGLSLQAAEQVLQEYTEMSNLYQAFHEKYAKSGETIQMLAGMGKPDAVNHTVADVGLRKLSANLHIPMTI